MKSIQQRNCKPQPQATTWKALPLPSHTVSSLSLSNNGTKALQSRGEQTAVSHAGIPYCSVHQPREGGLQNRGKQEQARNKGRDEEQDKEDRKRERTRWKNRGNERTERQIMGKVMGTWKGQQPTEDGGLGDLLMGFYRGVLPKTSTHLGGFLLHVLAIWGFKPDVDPSVTL